MTIFCDSCTDEIARNKIREYYYKGEHFWWCKDCADEDAQLSAK